MTLALCHAYNSGALEKEFPQLNTVIHWFRRDFRVADNTALAAAGRLGDAMLGVVVLDTRWFPASAAKTGAFQAAFWLAAIADLRQSLAGLNIPLRIMQTDDPVAALLSLAREVRAGAITFNKEYEPAQMAQDQRLIQAAEDSGLSELKIYSYCDAVIFEEFEVLTANETPYTVFTPYKRSWLAKFSAASAVSRGLPRLMPRDVQSPVTSAVPSAVSLGFPAVTPDIPTGESGGLRMLADFSRQRIGMYKQRRDFPAETGVSRLSAHLSAGTISIRQCVSAAVAAGAMNGCGGAECWLSELIWREFYRMVLFHFPHTVKQAFHRKFDTVAWENNPALLAAWLGARTGYPIVDAALIQIQTTGWMHNRLRMIAAMFLTKDLDIDWRTGEQWFMRWLMDYDQASNVGGWQWSAGTGTDAAPYFRVMNPILQARRFDAQGTFVRRYIPALARVPDDFVHEPWLMPPLLQAQCGCRIGEDYPPPVVDHGAARIKAIKKFQ